MPEPAPPRSRKDRCDGHFDYEELLWNFGFSSKLEDPTALLDHRVRLPQAANFRGTCDFARGCVRFGTYLTAPGPIKRLKFCRDGVLAIEKQH